MWPITLSRRVVLQRTRISRPRAPLSPLSPRFISVSSARCARKDSQDKDSLNPTAAEYGQSGSDDAAAANEDAAFNPNKTSPEEEVKTAEKGVDSNPLEVSPGNPEVSKPRESDEGGAQGSPKSSSGSGSGGGSPNKAGGGKSG
ncbi:hypothetical protein BDV95DRAFT_72516 [Massariosphaeria phaeospora]|uniref:Uncharacterized protein n=1 Tax=Massariosphaeria phaeospora TaxID=100035 RepID=A0A7C8M6N8_9PLEO|nr:hypothetical protein BDV95DRAFT_72516 [Massariosphaeria phaeospora]